LSVSAGSYKYGLGGQANDVNREDLIDVYTQQTPWITPWLAQAPKTDASSVLHQWLIDTLRSPVTTGAIEGAAYAYVTSTTPTRVTNVSMIFRKDIGVTRTQMKGNPAAIGNTYMLEMDKATKELATDIETSVFANLTSATGTTAAARIMKGFQNFITSNTARPASLGAAATAGQLVVNDFNRMLDTIYTAGGNPDQVFVSPSVKRQVSSFTLTQQNRNIAAAEKKLVQGIDMYDSDFGLLAVVLDRFVPQATNTTTAAASAADVSGTMFFLERAKNRWAWYDPLHHDYVGKLGDSINGIVVGEGTLEVLNEKANGLIKAINNKSSALGDA
jgi:uncharacterized protein DUF5309